MCGIVGIYGKRQRIVQDKNYINQCLHTMHRRGPDDFGTWDNGKNYIAGFVRLAIRDLSAHGHQPMISACGNYCLTFNGEIYNSDRFKSLLIKKGVQFRSTTDTEVLLYGLIHFGVEHVLEQYDGMFAFAFYDLKKNELIIARDRIGIKPLYIGFDDNDSVIYSSQYDHIINYRSLKNERLDCGAIGAYLQLGYVPDNLGAVRNTFLFPHGHFAVIDAQGFRLKKYFSFVTNVHSLPGKIGEQTFSDAANSQLVSDVPVGTYLSGGVDSSLLTLWANRNQAMKAFSIGSDDSFIDEKEDAERFARQHKINQCIYEIGEQDFLILVDDYFQSHTEPFADFSSIPSLLLSKLVSGTYKVILSGDGPDELFWGYDRNIKYLSIGKKFFERSWKSPGELLLSKITGKKTLVDRRMLKSSDFLSYYYGSLFLYGSNQLPSIYKGSYADAFFLGEIKKGYGEKIGMENFAYAIRDMEMNIHLQRVLLKVDRSAMYNSVEVRVPYLSNAIMDAAMNENYRNHVSDGHGKYLMKTLLANKISNDYAFKSKKGFLVPMHAWLRQSIKRDVQEKLMDMPAELGNLFNKKSLQKLLHAHIVKQEDYSGIIWAIYALVNWYQHHRDIQKLSA